MARTKTEIQRQALELFSRKGFDETTIAQVADAAEVSPMTVFRYFPTKEDLVMDDSFDEELVAKLQASDTGQDLITLISGVLLTSLSAADEAARNAMYFRLDLAARTPALRARRGENLFKTQDAIVDGLGGSIEDHRFEVAVAAGACLSALTTAMFRWAAGGGEGEMVALAHRAFSLLGAKLDRSEG